MDGVAKDIEHERAPLAAANCPDEEDAWVRRFWPRMKPATVDTARDDRIEPSEGFRRVFGDTHGQCRRRNRCDFRIAEPSLRQPPVEPRRVARLFAGRAVERPHDWNFPVPYKKAVAVSMDHVEAAIRLARERD